jgi:hypothetical protein
MKRLVLTLVAGAFGSLLVLPLANAQDYQDMSNDASQIHQDQRDIHHDKRDEQRDLEHGNLGAAAHEQAEIDRDRANENATKEDLSNDAAQHDDDWARHHHDDDND